MIKKGIYRHFKGGIYEVIGEAVHSETLEPMVVYRSMKDPEKMWVRPEQMWNERVVRDEYDGPRFTFIGDTLCEHN